MSLQSTSSDGFLQELPKVADRNKLRMRKAKTEIQIEKKTEQINAKKAKIKKLYGELNLLKASSPMEPQDTKAYSCESHPYLTKNQRKICQSSNDLLRVISLGAKAGIDECQWQFQGRRWNCTTHNETTVFGTILDLKSRETAFIYAISSAGIMHAIMHSCAKGELTKLCACDRRLRTRKAKEEFEWGGCSHNVRFGERFSKKFLDVTEQMFSDAGQMNIWNNNAGRKAVKHNMRVLCKCHGVSGSCSMKLCWRTSPDFRMVGQLLKDRFDGASKVKFVRRLTKLRPMSKQQKKPTKRDLVYLQDSPNFCNMDMDNGIKGTTGRKCNKTSYGLEGCNLLCCGRGYYTIEKRIEEDCDCKFFWCCRVICKKCSRVLEEHYCN